jgi:hypothetical protein
VIHDVKVINALAESDTLEPSSLFPVFSRGAFACKQQAGAEGDAEKCNKGMANTARDVRGKGAVYTGVDLG